MHHILAYINVSMFRHVIVIETSHRIVCRNLMFGGGGGGGGASRWY